MTLDAIAAVRLIFLVLGAQVLCERGAQNNSLEAGAGLCVSDFENPYVRQSAAARLRDVNAGRQCPLNHCC